MFFKLARNSSLVIRSFLTGLTHFVKSYLLPACHPVPAILLCHTSSTSYFQYFHYSVLPVCVCFSRSGWMCSWSAQLYCHFLSAHVCWRQHRV